MYKNPNVIQAITVTKPKTISASDINRVDYMLNLTELEEN